MPVVSKTTIRLYPPDVDLIDAWASANPDPDTGETPSRPTAIRRMIRSTNTSEQTAPLSDDDAPASRHQLQEAVVRILERLETR